MSFPKYPEYKDSGVEWLGEVPAHWESRRLKDEGRLVAGSAFPHENQEQKGLEFPFYKVGDLVLSSDGRTMGSPQHTISKREVLALRARIVPTGAVVWAKIGAALMLNRRRLVNVPCCIDNNMTAYIPDMERLSPLWAYYWTSQLDFAQFANPGAVPSLGEGYQKTLPLLLPPPQEQATIASFLDHEIARIDALVEEQQRLIELLKEKRLAVISHAVTKGLDPDVSMKDSGVEWLGEVPAHWEVRKASYIGRLFGSDNVPEDMVSGEGDVPYLKVGSLSTDRLEVAGWDWYVDPTVSRSYRACGHYVVFPKRGAAIFLNKVNVVSRQALIDPNLMGWEIEGRYSTWYFAYALKLRRLDELADVSTVPQINNKHIGPERFPVPPIEEQNEIVSYLTKSLGGIDELVATSEVGVKLLQERRSALISAAVTGKIDVRGWQPPAGSTVPEATQAEMV